MRRVLSNICTSRENLRNSPHTLSKQFKEKEKGKKRERKEKKKETTCTRRSVYRQNENQSRNNPMIKDEVKFSFLLTYRVPNLNLSKINYFFFFSVFFSVLFSSRKHKSTTDLR